jgi:hypothetical protein
MEVPDNKLETCELRRDGSLWCAQAVVPLEWFDPLEESPKLLISVHFHPARNKNSTSTPLGCQFKLVWCI